MSNYRSRGGPGPGDRRSYQSHGRDDFYDEQRSRSRSPPERRRNQSTQRRSPPHDNYRSRESGYRDDSHEARRSERSQNDGYGRDRGSPSPRPSRRYYDRDRPSDNYNRRPMSQSSNTPDPERPSSRGKPNKEILMEGLAPHITETDITNELKEHYHVTALDDVRVIRDRETKRSREFGFLRFSTLVDAEVFMDHNYPVLYLYGESSKSNGDTECARVRLTYGRERKDKLEEGDWICSSCHINNFATRVRCFRCQAPRTDFSAPVYQKAANIGDNDASPDNTPSQFLLIRGLEPSVSEELFAKGVAKLNKPNGSAQSSSSTAKKSAKVASTTGDANLGAREGTLRRVLLVRDRQSNDSWRYGFAEYASIDDAQAALTRYNSFDRFTIASKQVIVTYIHAGVFVPVFSPSASTERFLFAPLNNPSVRLQYWDEDAYVMELVVSAPEPPPPESKANQAAVAAQNEGLKSVKETEKIKKRKAEPTQAAPTKKATASHLQFWSNRHAELHGAKKNGSTASSDAGDDARLSQSFADPVRFCCYLCMRQFGDAAEVNKHERLSELHRQNAKDDVKVTKAVAKLQKHSVQAQQTQASSIEYRDRARERRKIYGVVNKKGEQVGSKPKVDMSDNEEVSTPAPSKGASLLSKMGYTAGQGLGASGEGMTAPISTAVYAAGVGLGAQGGKVGDAVETADRNTKGDYGTWAESVKQGARERYAQLE